MSFLRHRQIYQSDVLLASCRKRSCVRLRPRSHRSDEFAASYSLAGWSPPEPTSASPAGSIFSQPAETVNHLLRRVVHFSTGRMGNFQSVLTRELLSDELIKLTVQSYDASKERRQRDMGNTFGYAAGFDGDGRSTWVIMVYGFFFWFATVGEPYDEAPLPPA